MTGAMIILAVLIAAGIILYISDRVWYRRRHPSTASSPPEAQAEGEAEGECCGQHIVCEKESLSPFTTEAEYYDDEELDRFRDRPADSYTTSEEEEFRSILLTMRTEEIAGWVRSLQIRRISLPAEVRTEVLLIMQELREKNHRNND